MAFTLPASEARSFQSSTPPNPGRKRSMALKAAIRDELEALESQLGRFGEVEAAIRLRAFSELDERLSTHALCGLAAGA